MTVKKVCCLGLGQAGVPLSAVIATKCPEIKVTVVHSNAEQIFLWNAKQIPSSVYVPGLSDLIRKSQNKNLFFTTNEEGSIKEADMVFIISESRLKTFGEGKDKIVDLSSVEEAAFQIAEYSDSSKIVVETSAIPLKTAECVRKILNHNSRPGVRFQVLSNPDFYEEGTSIQAVLFPDRVLIGSENTPEGHAAAKELSFIFERWVLPENIITKDNWTTELSNLCSCAFAAQRLANVYALATICEETSTDVVEVITLMAKNWRLGSGFLNPGLGEGKLPKMLSSVVYMFECLGLSEVANYWQQVLEMNTYYVERFLKRLIWAMNQTALERRISILGLACYKDTTITRGSVTLNICKYLLEERATLSIYDPKVTKKQVIEDLLSASCQSSPEALDKAVSLHNDPYKAAFQSQVIFISCLWPEFVDLDFRRIFAEMLKPAYLFDGGNILQHSELLKIGFKVYTVGKFIKDS